MTLFKKRLTQLKAFSQRLKNIQDNCKMIIKSQIIKASCKVLSGKGRVGREGGQNRMCLHLLVVGHEPGYWPTREGGWAHGRKRENLGHHLRHELNDLNRTNPSVKLSFPVPSCFLSARQTWGGTPPSFSRL